jgi:hypothetical protein
VNLTRVFLVVAVVCFAIEAAIKILGGNVGHEDALVPLGLTFFAGSFLV